MNVSLRYKGAPIYIVIQIANLWLSIAFNYFCLEKQFIALGIQNCLDKVTTLFVWLFHIQWIENHLAGLRKQFYVSLWTSSAQPWFYSFKYSYCKPCLDGILKILEKSVVKMELLGLPEDYLAAVFCLYISG